MKPHRLGALLFALAALAVAPAASAQQDGGDIVAMEKDLGPAMAGFPTEFTPQQVKDYDKGVRAGALDALREAGRPIDPDQLIATTDVLRVGPRQVLRSRLEAPGFFMFQYAAVVGDHMFLVVCVSRDIKPFDPAGTECEAQVQRTFSR